MEKRQALGGWSRGSTDPVILHHHLTWSQCAVKSPIKLSTSFMESEEIFRIYFSLIFKKKLLPCLRAFLSNCFIKMVNFNWTVTPWCCLAASKLLQQTNFGVGCFVLWHDAPVWVWFCVITSVLSSHYSKMRLCPINSSRPWLQCPDTCQARSPPEHYRQTEASLTLFTYQSYLSFALRVKYFCRKYWEGNLSLKIERHTEGNTFLKGGKQLLIKEGESKK